MPFFAALLLVQAFNLLLLLQRAARAAAGPCLVQPSAARGGQPAGVAATHNGNPSSSMDPNPGYHICLFASG